MVSLTLPQDSAASKFLRSMDRNNDDRIAFSEWRGSSRSFLTYDHNRDGYLEVDELARKDAPRSDKVDAGESTSADQRFVAIANFGTTPPDYFRQACNACHNSDRILQARKDAGGWAVTVQRMREKQDDAFSRTEGERIVRYLTRLRNERAQAAVDFGTEDPMVEWGNIFDAAQLHRFDRDRNMELSGSEISRLLIRCLDFDADGELNSGEFRLMPVQADRAAAFAKVDRNKDGRVSLRELGVPEALMQVADVDGDRALSATELPRLRNGPYRVLLAQDVDTVFAVADRDRDQELSRRELKNGDDFFRLYDRDRNNKLTRPEVERALNLSRAQGLVVSFDDFLTRYDLNGDGKVVREEFSGPQSVFRRCDRNGDGAVGSKDLEASSDPPEFGSEAQRWR
jgi:hypothetical protein